MTPQPSVMDIKGDAGPTVPLPAILDSTGREQVEHLTQMLAAIVESSDDAIISKDLDGVITSWNRAAERIFGYTADEIIGRHISILMPPEHVEDIARILERIRRGERVDHFETKRRGKDGRIIDVSLTISPIRDADGTIIGASKVARDITERKRAEEERERLLAATQAAQAQAEAANRMKDEFLATLSHELRTPLNAILGWAKILRSGKVDADDLEEGLAAIERNSQAQAQLIDDLLDISRIIAGNLRLDLQRLSLAEVIEAALAAVLPAADAKGIRIHKVLDSLAGPVTGDFARLQQVVWNLLANAVKFTPKGGQVQVLLERVNSHVEISVIDTGIGIKPEFLPARLRPLPPGRRRHDAAARRPRPGAGHRQAPRRDARRHRPGQEPRRGPGGDVRPDAAHHRRPPRAAGAGAGAAQGSPPPPKKPVRTVSSPASRCSWSMTSPTPASSSAASSPIATPRWPSPRPPPRPWNSSSGSAPTSSSAILACPRRTGMISFAG